MSLPGISGVVSVDDMIVVNIVSLKKKIYLKQNLFAFHVSAPTTSVSNRTRRSLSFTFIWNGSSIYIYTSPLTIQKTEKYSAPMYYYQFGTVLNFKSVHRVSRKDLICQLYLREHSFVPPCTIGSRGWFWFWFPVLVLRFLKIHKMNWNHTTGAAILY